MHDEKENRQCDPGCGDVFVPGHDVLSDGSVSKSFLPALFDVFTLRGEECKTAGRPAKKEMLSLPAAGARGAFGVLGNLALFIPEC